MFTQPDEADSGGQWMSVSDLMAALMLIFMFIAIMFIRTIVTEEATYREECDKIYQVLELEFGKDFNSWDVELLEDLTIRFRNPEVLFESGSDQIRPHFVRILESFIPRYFGIIQTPKHREDIKEIRIEGHTSSVWTNATSPNDAYFKNMYLSQKRTQAILQFILNLPEFAQHTAWAKKLITANGLSSSHLIFDENGREDRVRSRRVEFRLMTTSCRKAGVYDGDSENQL